MNQPIAPTFPELSWMTMVTGSVVISVGYWTLCWKVGAEMNKQDEKVMNAREWWAHYWADREPEEFMFVYMDLYAKWYAEHAKAGAGSEG
jgi:hypothetical protein